MPHGGDLPFATLNGNPGYINLLDALNAWALVRELDTATGLPAAASFKHVSPSGVGLGQPLDENLARACLVEDLALSPVAAAYARARGTDRLCSFGDLAAVSREVDESLALLLSREVSDGIIAPAYTPEALRVLSAKKGGKYLVLQMDPAYEPAETEERDVYGVRFHQSRHARPVTNADLDNIVTRNRNLTPSALQDLKVAWVTLKYTQSNSVCFVQGGQTIGVGAGQQSRVHCVRLAAAKADLWHLRQHPHTLAQLKFNKDTRRPDRDNLIDQYLAPASPSGTNQARFNAHFAAPPQPFSAEMRQEALAAASGATLGSDAFFPFRDSIDRAAASGASFIMQPGGSARDDEVIAACDEYGMLMLFTGVRLFHH